MAEIAPFRGILYDTSRVDASAVLAPPYDVIDAAGRAELAGKDPHNCVNLILPEAAGDADAKYAHARDTLAAWLKEGVLGRDLKPAIYRYHQVFEAAALGGKTVTRRGFIAAARLHNFDERVILPHERTLRGPKIDRLKLWGATQAHLSQIFTMYADPSGDTDRAFAAVEEARPTIDGTTADGTRHLVWRVDDPEVIQSVQKLIAPLSLYIADGHHRYETMLALREQIREQAGGELAPNSAANFGMMFLANMSDSGLIVLPTHRLVHSLDSFKLDTLVADLAQWFDAKVVTGAARNADQLRDALADAGARGAAFAAITPDSADATLLTLRADFDPAAAGVEGAPAVQRLDVTLLHQLVLERTLGIDRAAQEAQTNLVYVKDTQKALDKTAAGAGQVCFIMNATPVDQVCAVSDAGEVMPQKSTFFYPKIASGLVMNPVRADETL